MKKVFIAGINGNMGSRYAVICRSLGIDVYGSELASFTEQSNMCVKHDIDGIIIATPTFTHVDAINVFGNQAGHIPMLVEKPIRRGLVKTMPDYNVTMVNQYKYLIDSDRVGLTYYNYFKTGGDGLFWDCINIIGLAKGEISLKKQSPFWRCSINGQRINIKSMDKAYYEMIHDWTSNPEPNREYIEQAHGHVVDMIEAGLETPETAEKRNELKALAQVVPINGEE